MKLLISLYLYDILFYTVDLKMTGGNLLIALFACFCAAALGVSIHFTCNYKIYSMR